MAVVDFESAAESRVHRRSFLAFERVVLFAVMHVALTLSCLALAFLGNAPIVALLPGVGGTLALIVGFAVTASSDPPWPTGPQLPEDAECRKNFRARTQARAALRRQFVAAGWRASRCGRRFDYV
jgi:hypothetical protein